MLCSNISIESVSLKRKRQAKNGEERRFIKFLNWAATEINAPAAQKSDTECDWRSN